MKKTAVLVLFLLLVPAGLGYAWAQEAQGPKPRRTVVTLDGKLEDVPDLTPTDFELEIAKQKTAPARVIRPTELPTLIAVVLQDNQVSEFSRQLPALRDFIISQPPNTYVGLFYFSVQSIQTAFPFHSDLQKVANALRAPHGTREMAPPSPYNNLTQLIEGMAALPDARKEILIFTEGSDALSGATSASQNQNLRQAISAAQEAGIPVFAVYTDALPPVNRTTNYTSPVAGSVPDRGSPIQPSYSPAGGTDRSSSGSPQFGAQTGADVFRPEAGDRPPAQYNISYLNDMTERTGGKVFSPGKIPPDITPYLAEFQRLLRQQVILEYSGPETVKRVKLKRKLGSAKLLAPKR